MIFSKHTLIKLKVFFPVIRDLKYYSGQQVKFFNNHDNLIVQYENQTEHFPLVWLRDNCRCENCFHRNSHSRIINWNNFDIDVKLKSIETTKSSDVIIKWEDDHVSKFSLIWLKKRSFSKENQDKFLNETYKFQKILWDGNDMVGVIKRYDYNDIMKDDNQLYKCLKNFAIYGTVFLSNAPPYTDECCKLAKRIAFVRKTHYGEEFPVAAKLGTSNVAYLSSLLQLHTDLPYYEYQPGATILHCIEQTNSQGGENLLTDAFFVAELLRNANKNVFDILSTVDVNWLDVGEEDGVRYDKIVCAPMISLNSKGNITNIRHSIPQRDSYFTVDVKYVKPWYKALKTFIDLLNKHAYKFKLQPGEMFAFDNVRLVHGRLGYNDTAENRRLLAGCYIDWDEIYSKIRVLQERFKKL